MKLLSNLKKLFDPFHKEIEKKIKEYAESLPDGSIVLNAGSGEGAYVEYFKHCQLIGIDLCVGDETWDYSSVDLVGDLHKMPFKKNLFDACICVVVMEHLHSPLKFLKELSRVMKKNGTVFVVFPFLWELHQEPFDFFRYTPHGFKKLIEETNFEISELNRMGGFFRVMHYRTASFIKYSFKKPALLLLLIPMLPFIIFLMIFSEFLDRNFELCEHTLGFNSILKKE